MLSTPTTTTIEVIVERNRDDSDLNALPDPQPNGQSEPEDDVYADDRSTEPSGPNGGGTNDA